MKNLTKKLALTILLACSSSVFATPECTLQEKYVLKLEGKTPDGFVFTTVGTLEVSNDITEFTGVLLDKTTGLIKRISGEGFIELKEDCRLFGDLTILNHIVVYTGFPEIGLIGNVQIQNVPGLAPITGKID